MVFFGHDVNIPEHLTVHHVHKTNNPYKTAFFFLRILSLSANHSFEKGIEGLRAAAAP